MSLAFTEQSGRMMSEPVQFSDSIIHQVVGSVLLYLLAGKCYKCEGFDSHAH